jgi:hypothetical protein
MRKTILSSVIGTVLFFVVVFLAVAGSTLSRRSAVVTGLQGKITKLTSERDSLVARLEKAEQQILELQSATPDVGLAADSDASLVLSFSEAELPPNSGPQVTTNAHGKLSYFFPELFGADGAVIAHSAQFREVLGNTKISFRTSNGVRYFALDEVHPEAVRSLGYDPDLLKRRAAEEFRLAQIRGAQAQMRNQAAAEYSESQRAETLAALRDAAQASELMAEPAQRSPNYSPRVPSGHQKAMIVMPYGSGIVQGGGVGGVGGGGGGGWGMGISVDGVTVVERSGTVGSGNRGVVVRGGRNGRGPRGGGGVAAGGGFGGGGVGGGGSSGQKANSPIGNAVARGGAITVR